MTMNLRDEIARAVARAVDRAMDGERAMTPPPLGGWHPLVTDAVDDILATVREALLSDEAIRAAWETGIEYGESFQHPDVTGKYRKSLTAALGAITTD